MRRRLVQNGKVDARRRGVVIAMTALLMIVIMAFVAFGSDDEGFGVVLVPSPDGPQRAQADAAVRACPERAIHLHDETGFVYHRDAERKPLLLGEL